jgi:hypothetical protein
VISASIFASVSARCAASRILLITSRRLPRAAFTAFSSVA